MTLDLLSVGTRIEPRAFRYEWKDLALYALGIGAQAEDLDYVYEARGPKLYPTFAVVPALPILFECLGRAQVPLAAVIHGAQRVQALAAAPSKGVVMTSGEIAGIYDMKKFAQVLIRTSTALESGEPVFETEWSIIVRGAGGFGGAPPPRGEDGAPPDRPADLSHEQATLPQQALLYRLSGDINPLHVDPDVAKAAGFDRGPILHGLATFGFAARGLIARACGGDAARLHTIHGQFRRPVWPGETLLTEIWKVSDDKLVYQVRARERDEVVIGNAWARLRI